ncbi:MAG TPA: MMPL family transporter [Mycobacteriales bacterium]
MVRTARWSALHPWRAIAGWLVFVAVCAFVGGAVGLRTEGDQQGLHGQSAQAAQWLHGAGLDQPDTEDVLISARAGGLDRTAALRAAADVTRRLTSLSEVSKVAAPVTSPDGSAVLVEASLTTGASAGRLLAATAATQAAAPALRVEEVGSASFDDAVNHQVAKDLGAAAALSLPVTLIIMILAFGAVVAAGVPVLLALSAVGAATGLSSLVSHVLPDSGSTSSMILLMGMAVGVDYSLFYVTRARAERRRGLSPLAAVEVAAATSGHAVVVSGADVITSMAGLFLATDMTFTSLAAGSIIVVAVAVVGSLTVLPALLVTLGGRIDRLRVPFLGRERAPRLWPAVLRPVVAHPGRALVASVAVLGALAVPAFGLRLAADSPRSLPSTITETHALGRLTAAFPGTTTTHDVVVTAPAGDAGEVTRRLHGLAGRLGSDPSFVAGTASYAASADGTVHTLRMDAPFDPESTGAKNGVRTLRSAETALAQGMARAKVAVGGETAADMDTDAHLSARLPWVVAGVVLVTMVIMALVFGSVAISLVTAAANLLSAGAAFGVLALVFGHHWFDGLLGYTSTGTVINWIPLFTFAVLFGLSMDYHVFVLSRVREAARAGVPLREAVRDGVTRSAGTVTSAALVMVSVFAIFASLHMVEMKELGFGLAVAVLVDALVVRTVVLPAALCLLGRWAWWPGRQSSASSGRALATRS